jgi:tyrosinase
MTNFLSPVDPVFYLHHSNIDRLWDVWSRKQRAMHLTDRPDPKDEAAFMDEPFRFFVDSEGKYVTNAKAGNYFSMDVFGYAYAPGTGEELVSAPAALTATAAQSPVAASGAVRGNIASVKLPRLAAQARLVAAVTLPHPEAGGSRLFDVLVNAPPGVTHVAPDSPIFAGRIAFSGAPMGHMHGPVTFLVPLPQQQSGGRVLAQAVGKSNIDVTISVVPAQGAGRAPSLARVTVQAF